MPEWMEEAYQEDIEFRKGLLEQGTDISDFLSQNPREILGPSDLEQLGLEMGLEGSDLANFIAEQARRDLGGGREGYESGYTEDVVDTTLAGMQRRADRERLRREGQSAAIGGTSNTRSAVADAVASQLTGMDMAQMEAQLRDEGFRFGAEKGLEEAELLDRMATSELSRRLTGAGLLGSYGEMERALEQARLDEERTSGQQGLSWLADLFSGSQHDKGPVGGTETTTTSGGGGSLFSQLLGAGVSLGGAFLGSDERIKEDIEAMDDGLEKIRKLEPSEYRYKDGHGHVEGRTSGLMAQDIEDAGITGAVVEIEGVKHVDPYPVLASVVKAVQELDAKVSEAA